MSTTLSELSPRQMPRRMVGNFLRQPLIGNTVALFFRDRIPNKGCRINTSNAAITPATKASLLWGLYERDEIRFVRNLMRSDCDVVDLGSSIGAVSAHIARRMCNSHQLVCVEANPILLSSIRQNTRSHARNTSIVHGAIYYNGDDNYPETIQLSLGNHSTESKIGSDKSAERLVEVPATTLSKVLEDHQIDKYVLVSDIEGAEIGFIEEETEALRRCQQLIIELHETKWDGHNITINELCQLLEERHGFHLRAQRQMVYVFDKN